MTAIRGYHLGPRALAALFVLLVVALISEVAIVVWVYEQGQTEHQICQAFQYIGDRTQQQITLNVQKLKNDQLKHDTPAIALDRKSIGDATTFLIRVQRVQC